MGYVYADIILKNTKDVLDVKRGYLPEEDIRQVTVHAMVDTGAGTLIINESVRQKLGLEVAGERPVSLADNTAKRCIFTEPVEIHWQNRYTTLRPIVLPDAEEVLLGAIPLEDMDLIVHPLQGTLVGAHGDTQVCRV